MKDNIKKINWALYSGPEYYNPNKVPKALRQLECLSKDSLSHETYNTVLFSIGNNHAGTYYPAAIEAIRIIIDIALKSELEVARNCSLDIIIDLYCSFIADSGKNNCCTDVKLEKSLRDIVESNLKSFKALCLNPDESQRNIRLSEYLIEAIIEIKDENSQS